MPIVESINSAVQTSFVGPYFEMEKRGATFFAELRGAAATFMSMAYILAVNPRILADSGGPCVPNEDDGGITGPTYMECQEVIKREYVTSTAIASMFGCFAMGILANLPIALAPGMGMVRWLESMRMVTTRMVQSGQNMCLRLRFCRPFNFTECVYDIHGCRLERNWRCFV